MNHDKWKPVALDVLIWWGGHKLTRVGLVGKNSHLSTTFGTVLGSTQETCPFLEEYNMRLVKPLSCNTQVET